MKTWILWYVLSGAYAGSTSVYKISQGCHEVNPLAPSNAIANGIYKAGTTIGLSFAFNFADQISPKSGRWLALTGIGVNVLDGSMNLRQHC